MTERIEAFNEDHLDDCSRLLVATFNTKPWNDSYTHDTAKAQLAWHLRVPGCLGLVSVSARIAAFAIGYVEPTDEGDVYHLSIFCVRPDVQRTGVGTRLLRHLEGSLRDAEGYSQEGFALRAGLHPTYLNSIEQGNRNISIRTADQIARALGTDLPSLFSELEQGSIDTSSD